MKRLSVFSSVFLGLVLVWLLVGYVTLSFAAFQFTPLPLELRITPPSLDLPKNIAGFSGTWYGIWDNGHQTTLVVEKIEPPIAIAVYSWGEYKGKEGGWRRSEWKIGPNKLENDSEGGITITYFLSDDGKTLEGTYIRRDKQTRINYITIQRDIPVSQSTISNHPTPLPPEVRITPPSLDLPKNIAGFSGTWYGIWDNGRKTTLVVEKIEPPKVIAVYSYGEYKGKDGGWTRWEWTIKPGRLELRSDDKLMITYLLLANGELKGTWKKGWIKLEGIMRKQ